MIFKATPPDWTLCTMLPVVVTVYALLAVGCNGSALKGPRGFLDDWEGIINGVPANLGEFPSQVSLQWVGNGTAWGKHLCGASILNKEWVLTAAHCVNRATVATTSVLSGTVDIESGEGTMHPISKIVYHADYNSSDSWINDIAVVKVSVPFDLDGFLRAPVKLPEQDQTTADGANATVIGWGRLSISKITPRLLQKVGVFIANQEECKASHSLPVFPTQICADFPGSNAGACQGDSGGPLFVDNTIVGIVSWGPPCAEPGFPTVFTRVSCYWNWIKDNISD